MNYYYYYRKGLKRLMSSNPLLCLLVLIILLVALFVSLYKGWITWLILWEVVKLFTSCLVFGVISTFLWCVFVGVAYVSWKLWGYYYIKNKALTLLVVSLILVAIVIIIYWIFSR